MLLSLHKCISDDFEQNLYEPTVSLTYCNTDFGYRGAAKKSYRLKIIDEEEKQTGKLQCACLCFFNSKYNWIKSSKIM